MRPASVLLALAALLGLTGCPFNCPDSGCTQPCAIPLPPGTPDQPGIVLVGEPATLVLPPATPGGCGDTPQPTSATSEVHGPDGTLIPSEVQFLGPSATLPLQFTPPRPGPYHVLVAFSPVGGLQQFDLHAALNRSAEAPRLTLPGRCGSLERTSQGTWVCENALIRGDTVEERFNGARLGVAGDVVWRVAENQVQRYVDTGSALTETHVVPYLGGPVEFLLAGTDELLLLLGNRLVHITTQGEPRVTSSSLTLSVATVGPQAPRGVLLRDGEHVALIHRPSTDASTSLEACPYRLSASGPVRTQDACQQLPGFVAGFEPGVLWTADAPQGFSGASIRRWTWAAGRLEEQSALALGRQVDVVDSQLYRATAVPIVRSFAIASRPPLTAVVTWSPERRQLILEHVDPDILESFASPSFYWGRMEPLTSSTSTRVRIRPSTP